MAEYDRRSVATVSLLNAFADCPHRVWLTNVKGVIGMRQSAEARRGTIVHQAIALVEMGVHDNFRDAAFVAEKDVATGADRRELDNLYERVMKRYGDPPVFFDRDAARDVMVEKPFYIGTDGQLCADPRDAVFAGTIDLLVALKDEPTVVVRDYKTGFVMDPESTPIEEIPQMAVYGYAATLMYPDADLVALELDYIRWGYGKRRAVLAREDFAEVWATLVRDLAPFYAARRAVLNDGKDPVEAFPPQPSDLCAWCEVRHVCPAFAGIVPAMPEPPAQIETDWQAHRLASAWERNKGLMKSAESALKAYADANGPIVVTDGKVLTFVPNDTVKSIDIDVARKVFMDHGFTQEMFDAILTTTKGALEELAGDNAKDIMKALSDAGAFKKGSSPKFMAVKDKTAKIPPAPPMHAITEIIETAHD